MERVPRMTKAEKDFWYTLKFVHPLLGFVGAWPLSPGSSVLVKLAQHVLSLTMCILLLFVLVPCTLYLFLKVEGGRNQLKILPPIVNSSFQFLKYTVLLYRKNEVRGIIDELRKDMLNATDEDRLIMRTKARIGHGVVIMMAITLYSGGLGYRTILPLSKGRILLPNNTTMRLLPCPGYFPLINEQDTPYYEIIFTLQVLAGFISYTLFCGTTGFLATICLHTASSLRILMNKFIELNEHVDASDEYLQTNIVEIVEYQNKIGRFLTNAEAVTKYLCFFEIVSLTCVSCIVGYCIILEWEDSNATAMGVFLILQVTIIFTTFTICYIGQLLLDESDNVRETVITMNWYKFPIRKARYLILIINMTNRPLKLTATKVLDVSLDTFTNIVKTSMAYFNMLREIV